MTTTPKDGAKGAADGGDGGLPPDAPLVEGRDYYYDPNGLWVLTATYLKRRGYCCGSGCRHCPYGGAPKS